MVCVGVDRALDAHPGLQGLQVADDQIGFKGVRVVIVLAAADLEGHSGLVPVVVVVVDDAHRVTEPLLDVLGQRGLAAAGAAGDADKNCVSHSASSPKFPGFRQGFPFIIESAAQKSKAAGEHFFPNPVKTEKWRLTTAKKLGIM